MTPEQKAAYIMAQAAALNARVAGMRAENDWRISCGNSIAYTEEHFEAVVTEYGCHHNQTIAFFQGV